MNESDELAWMRQLPEGDELAVGEFWRDYGERWQRQRIVELKMQ